MAEETESISLALSTPTSPTSATSGITSDMTDCASTDQVIFNTNSDANATQPTPSSPASISLALSTPTSGVMSDLTEVTSTDLATPLVSPEPRPTPVSNDVVSARGAASPTTAAQTGTQPQNQTATVRNANWIGQACVRLKQFCCFKNTLCKMEETDKRSRSKGIQVESPSDAVHGQSPSDPVHGQSPSGPVHDQFLLRIQDEQRNETPSDSGRNSPFLPANFPMQESAVAATQVTIIPIPCDDSINCDCFKCNTYSLKKFGPKNKIGIFLIINIININNPNETLTNEIDRSTTNETMTNQKRPGRAGAEKDEERLVEEMEALHFEVVVKRDLTVKQIHDTIHEYSKMEDHKNFSIFGCALMTHGQNDDRFISSDDRSFSLKDLTESFEGDKCKHLLGKPKIFFVQACRGTKPMLGAERIESDVNLSSPMKIVSAIAGATPRRIPIAADFLISYAVVDGYRAIRLPDEGSWFIQELCDCLRTARLSARQTGKGETLLRTLTRVNRGVAAKTHEESRDVVQIPSFSVMLTKDLVLT